MKKYFTILMAVLCLCAFSFDADAKTRKKTRKRSATSLTEGYYYIRSSVDPNYVIDVFECRAENLNNVHLWSYYAGESQKWYLEHVGRFDGKGVYKIHSALDYDYVLDLAPNTGNVCLYEDCSLDSQKWLLKKSGKNTYNIECYYNNGLEMLDLDGAIAVDGRNIQVYDANWTNAQYWILERASD